ncbi:PREDICTED: uncharacterized protein LOC109207231 [Nicotiana attenuata]|uniref:Uncharacterized protein n=1 Tax=Nicotiana attenuata TaxID=49451 RepID=A0A314KUU1_NICAT|nr:PREDICTED: uncharacterized protein LOC109207231 [Nicotiana attenuata]OIT32519.1 hypothetical protein A4A49_08535 [Nicotiana attenuata]
MNDQNKQDHLTAPTILPVKRRRGRPRKDGGLAKRVMLQTPTTPATENSKTQQHAEVSQKDSTSENMLGQIISGVIDGCFDAGYFLSIKIGNSANTFRGLVFEPGRFSPITAANDIAPQVKMYHRSQVIKLQDQDNRTDKPNQLEKQLNVSPGQDLLSEPVPNATLVRTNQHANPDQTLKTQSQYIPILENLRMVEQDEVMQVFEVANQSESPKLNAEQGKCVVSESILEPKAGEETIKRRQNKLTDSIIQPVTLVYANLNSSNESIQHNNVVDKSQETDVDHQQQVEPEVEKNKSNLGISPQPKELVQCELKKLNFISQELTIVNPELQPKELSQTGQGNQDLQPHQNPPFSELNSVAQESLAAESKVQSSDPIHNEVKSSSFELHYVDDMPQAVESVQGKPNPDRNQVLVTDDNQVLPQESISESTDFMMEKQSFSNIAELQQSTHIGTEVKAVGNQESSHERKQATDPSDEVVLVSQCAPQPEDADTEKSDYAANLETQTNSHSRN